MKSVEAKRPNPFPGLRPFRSDEHHLFFGREEQTAALLQLLRTNRFLAVVGTSGSGKSSLVRAGMIAELYGGTMTQAGSTWEVMVLRPGGSPIENLARALVDADLYDSNDQSTLPRLLATLSRSRFGLVEAMKQSEMFEPSTNLLVVVDQFEELFRFRQQGVDSEETAAAFVNLLLTASEQAECPIFVTITMRSDYLGDCSEIPGLAEAVNKGEYLIPRLLRDQKRDAIEKPIGVGGAKISPMLVQRLLNDVGDDSDQLPVLQHALMRMWDTWLRNSDHIRPIDFGDLEATGGLASALSNHADEIFDALPDDRHRSACEKIFKTLTEKGDDNRGIRRPTRLARLQAISDSDRGTVTLVLDAFRASGVTFLMPGAEIKLDDRTVFDLSHESLMRGWQRLRAWVEDEAQSARIFRRLLDTARLWSEAKAGLFRDPDLQIALSWREKELPNAEWAEQYGGEFETAIGFLEASNTEVQAELHAREASRHRELEQARRLAEAQQLRLDQQQRAARRLRMMIAGLAAVALFAALACVAALLANRRANTLAENARQNEEKANQNASQAERSEKRAANALAVVASQKAEVEGSLSKAEAAERSARAAEEAGRKLLYTTDMRLAPFVWSDDRTTAEQLRTLLAKHVPEIKTGDLNQGTPAVLKPDLRGFEWYYFQQLLENSAAVFSGHGVALDGGALTSNGQLTTLDRNGQLRRWDVQSRAEVHASRRELPGGPGAQFRLLSPDGRLAALTDDNMVHVFDTSTGNESFKINWAKAFPRRLLFSRASSMLVIIDDQIRWFSASSGAPIASVDKKYNRIESLAVSGDGLTLAVVGHGKTGNLFSIFRLDAVAKKATPLATDVNYVGTMLASALTSDGSRIAVGAKLSGTLSVFDTASGRLLAQQESAHASPISAMAFSADANLATADAQGTIKIWAAAQYLNSKSVARFTLKGHQGAIGSVNFSSDGRRLISSSLDKSARVWDLENGGGAIRPLERLGAPFMVRLSADSQLIAAASGPNVRLWDTSTGQLVRELPTFSKSLMYSVAFSPTDNRLLAVGYGGEPIDSSVALWDIDTGTELARLPGASDLPDFTLDQYSGAVGALAFSPDGKLLVAGFGAKNMLFPSGLPTPLKVWDVASRGLIRRLNGHTGTCVALDFSRDGTRLASGGRDGTAMIWSTKTWKATQTLKNPDVDSLYPEPKRRAMVEDVAFSPDGKSLAMASREGNVLLWDVATGKLLESLEGHSSAVDSLAFSPDGRTLASGSSDQTVRLWNVETRSELLKMDPADVPLGAVRTLAFSPDGKHLVAGGRRAAFWSGAPVVWANPDQAAAELRRLLNSNADFQSRIRMLSENLQLHSALEKLDSKDVRVRAALAATRANWHASREEWSEAVAAFDRLVAADPAKPEAWLRTPGLFRLATALFRQDRPAVAATLLRAGGKRRTQDGLRDVVNQVGVGVVLSESDGAIRVTELQPEFPRSKTGLAVGDTVVKVNDFELIGQSGPKLIALLAGEAGTTLRLQVRKVGSEKPEVIELTRELFVIDPATGKFLRPLGAAVNERLANDPRDAGLLELRAELAGQQIDFASQAADYTAAIKVLTEKPAEASSAHLKRLYHRRADAYLSLEKWSEALDDYSHLGKDETPDDDLLTNRAVAEMMRTPEKRKRFAAMKFTGPSQKLAAIYRLNDDQAAIDRLVERQPQSAGPIGDLFTEGKPDDKDWQRAIAFYSKAITPVTTDVALLSKRARAHEALKNWEAAAADWSQAAAATPDGAKLLADSARRLAAHGKVALATVHFEAAQARYERTLADDPDNDMVVPELAQLLWDKKDNESPIGWTVLEPTKMKSRGGATLTKLDDRSILAGGVNPPSDIYDVTFTIPENTHARAIRLETLTHDSLPEKGPGRSMLDRGVFMLQNWDLTVKRPGTADSLHSLGLGTAHADYAWNNLPVGFNQFWSIASVPGKNHTSVWSLLEPVTLEAGTELLSRMQFNETPDWRDQNLGRFRLSVSSDSAAFDREKIRFAAMKLTDPAAKLAVAFALYHRNDEALQYFSTALKHADGYEARKPIIALVASFDDVALVLSKRRPDDPQLQLALARQHAARGKQRLAQKQPAEARAELERSYEIFSRLRTERRQPLWTVLKPTVMKSEGGATLTLRPDGAILAGGKNPDRDSYSVVAKPAFEHITAIRLEALPDPSLPQNGPGRFSDSGIGGNFHLNELRVFSGGKPSTLANVIVNYDQIHEFRCLIDGTIDESMGWSNWPRSGLKNAAIVATRVDRAPDDDLKIELYCSRSRSLFHNLGCFRLSVTNDASAFEMELLQNDLPDSDVAELNVALGKARALQGQTNEAAANFREALDLAADRAAKARIVMEAAPLDGVLEKLAELASGDAQVQAELARSFAIRQNRPLADAARTKARALFEAALSKDPANPALATELADLVLDATAPEWITLIPAELTSQGGATLTLRSDGSILAGGTNPDRDVYTLVAKPDLKRIAAIRLEALTDSSLPNTGPGRSGAGNFHMSEIRVFSGGQPANLTNIMVVYADQEQFRDAIDGKLDQNWGWGVWPRTGQNNTALITTRFERAPDDNLKIELFFSRSPQWTQHNLGCLRLSVSGDPAIIARERPRFAAMALLDPWAKLAAARQLAGDPQALGKLLEQHPKAAAGIAELYAAAGDWDHAFTEFRKALPSQPADGALLTRFGEIYLAAGRTCEALPLLAKASAAIPENTILSMKVAALQAWFGQDAELAASRQRIIGFAQGKTASEIPERAAKACSLTPSANKAELAATLALGRAAVTLARNEWSLLSLGMVEYRSGHDTAAEEALLAAAGIAGTRNPVIANSSAFYRAMSLFRQGKKDDARKLAIATAAKMQPLPTDEKNPLAGYFSALAGGGDPLENLVMWLAYKEAKAMITFDVVPAPTTPVAK